MRITFINNYYLLNYMENKFLREYFGNLQLSIYQMGEVIGPYDIVESAFDFGFYKLPGYQSYSQTYLSKKKDGSIIKLDFADRGDPTVWIIRREKSKVEEFINQLTCNENEKNGDIRLCKMLERVNGKIHYITENNIFYSKERMDKYLDSLKKYKLEDIIEPKMSVKDELDAAIREEINFIEQNPSWAGLNIR